MRKLRDILRMRLSGGCSIREINRSTKVSVGSIQKLLTKAQAGLEIAAEKKTWNSNAQWMVQSGLEGETPWFDVGLDGAGQVVALSDTGIDVNNCE